MRENICEVPSSYTVFLKVWPLSTSHSKEVFPLVRNEFIKYFL